MQRGLWLILQSQGTSYAPDDLAAAVVAGDVVLAWTDTALGNSDYSVERRDVTAGDAFAAIATVGSGIGVTYTDHGPFTDGHRYAFRLCVVGGENGGEYSNAVAVFGGQSHRGRLRRAGYR